MELSSHPLAPLLTQQRHVSTPLPLQRNHQHTLVTDTMSWCRQVSLHLSRASDKTSGGWYHHDITCAFGVIYGSTTHIFKGLLLSLKWVKQVRVIWGENSCLCASVPRDSSTYLSRQWPPLQFFIDPNRPAPPLTHGVSAGTGFTTSVTAAKQCPIPLHWSRCISVLFCPPVSAVLLHLSRNINMWRTLQKPNMFLRQSSPWVITSAMVIVRVEEATVALRKSSLARVKASLLYARQNLTAGKGKR